MRALQLASTALRRHRWVGLGLTLCLVLALGGSLASLLPGRAHAATVTVTTCTEAALDAAVAAASPGDTVTFGCSGTITLTSTLAIAKNLTLDGTGHNVTLDGHHSVQVLSVASGVHFTLNHLTVADGLSVSGGGGLFNSGTVTMTNSVFSSNDAFGFGGGLYNDSGATATITGSTFSSNTASDSSMLYTGIGGGLYNLGTVMITSSTFAGNGATAAGGGLSSDQGTVTITNSTFTSNGAVFGAGGLGNGGGGTLTTINSIVANSNSPGGVTNNNCGGTITDGGYNLDSGTTCGFSAAHHSLPGTNPHLATSLAHNGGPTQTLALLPGSPAIDAGGTSANGCPATDQRGVSRPQGAACDIGAYEFVPTTKTTLTANPNPGLLDQPVQLCATVKPTNNTATPTGSVSFKEGATTLGTGSLNSSSIGCFTTSTLSLGDHSITASYGGSGARGFSASTSAPLVVSIQVQGQDVAGGGAGGGNPPYQPPSQDTGGQNASGNGAGQTQQHQQPVARQPGGGFASWLGSGLGLLLLLLGLGGLGAVFYRASRRRPAPDMGAG